MDLHILLEGRRLATSQIYRQIREAVMDGRLRPGQALPSSRELARRLSVSRTTVVVAYERLRAEGFVRSRIGAGTFVADGIRSRASTDTSSVSPLRSRPLWNAIREVPDMSALRPDFDFRPGIPDARHFPFASWRARYTRQLRPGAVGNGAHIAAAGDIGLREAITRHIGVSRGVRARPDDILITNGSQQAIDLVARVLLEPGDLTAVEDPGYPLARMALEAHGCRVAGVPVDADGIVVDAIPPGTRLVYVTPSHQYPLGTALSMERRQALLTWANAHDAAILEDDYDSEFRYDGRPLEPLRNLDGAGRVLYVGSFSKVLLPTLRLGFLIAPAPLHGALRKARRATDWHTAVPVQAAAARFIDDGLLAQHVRRMRRIYVERHERITHILDRDFAGLLTPLPNAGGLHLAAFLEATPGEDRAAAERAAEHGIAIFALTRYYVATPPRPGFLFGYGAIAGDRIETGLARLRACL